MSNLNSQAHASSNILITPVAGGVSSPPAPGRDQLMTMRPVASTSTVTAATSTALSSDPNAGPYPNQSYLSSGKSPVPAAVTAGVPPASASTTAPPVFRADSSTTATSNSSPVISALGHTSGMNANRKSTVKTHNNKRGQSRSGSISTGAVGAVTTTASSSRSGSTTTTATTATTNTAPASGRGTPVVANKRRCVSNACIACRKRKSKCDGNTPSCAACSSVYGTECVYDPSSDHRRKGVYKKDIDNLKTRNGTLQTLIQALLDYPEEQAQELVHAMRSSDNLEDVAEAVIEGKFTPGPSGAGSNGFFVPGRGNDDRRARSGSHRSGVDGEDTRMDRDDIGSRSSSSDREPTFESELSQRMSQLRVDSESGQVRFIGGTSNLILLPSQVQKHERSRQGSPNFSGGILERSLTDPYLTDRERNPVLSWTNVLGTSIEACEAVDHLLNMYFSWHYPYFTTLSRELFFRDFCSGYSSPVSGLSPRYIPDSPSFNRHSPSPAPSANQPMRYCTPLLVNAMLALGCHFTAHPLARTDKDDPDTAGDHFFYECKRLILENDEHVTPRLTTVQALALMSVREAGCAREERGWSYSGMSFRMGIEMGLNLDLEGSSNDNSETRQRSIGRSGRMNDEELDARRITFWGCFLFDKCWSNYMGRMPQLPTSMVSVQKYIIIPSEDAAVWCPYTDVGKSMISAQPARTRAVALQVIELCEISSDLLIQFYNPNPKKSSIVGGRSSGIPGGLGKSEIRNLGSLWQRLEDWKKKLPRELEPQQGCLPPVLLMHMFHQLLYIHLFRPFLQSTSATLPTLSLDPRKICVEAASKISKYLRFYKREYGLRQICNIAAYMIHSACTIHLLNLPEKSAKRDIVQGLRSLEDMAEGWLCARRALVIIRILAKRWKIDLPDEGVVILARAAKGRAEQFGLQEIQDEDYESSYLDYRGSSASAVSPMSLASEPSKQSSVPAIDTSQVEPATQHQSNGTLQPSTGNKSSISASRKGSNVATVNSNHSSPGLVPSPAPRQKIRQQRPQQQKQHQEQLSQVAPGFRYHTDESAASSPGAYVPISPFTHQMQTSFSQSHSQHQYVPERSSPLLMQGVTTSNSTPPPPQQTYAAHSPGASAPARITRDLSNNGQAHGQTHGQTQYSYFDNPPPPSSIASPSAFYSDTGIPIGYGHTPDELQGTAMEPNWCIRDQELMARGFLVQGWMSGELGTRGSIVGTSGGGSGGAGGGTGTGTGGAGNGVRTESGGNDEDGGGVGGETPWDPFRVY